MGALSDGSSGIYFYTLVEDNFVKGLINNNFSAKPDVIWNGASLFILLHDSSPPEAPSWRDYTNTAMSERRKLTHCIKDFPLTCRLPETFSTLPSIKTARALWATYTDTLGGSVHVIWSTSKIIKLGHRRHDSGLWLSS